MTLLNEYPATNDSQPKANDYHRYLVAAFDYFNQTIFEKLFNERLPEHVITLTNRPSARGYFGHKRFAAKDTVCSEISICHASLWNETIVILSTLVHEMVHGKEFHDGKQAKTPKYHGKYWAKIMKQVGLQPLCVDNGAKDGQETGYKCTHTIIEGGLFEETAKQFIEVNGDFVLSHGNSISLPQVSPKKKRPKYTCECGYEFSVPKEVAGKIKVICECKREMKLG